MDATIICQHIFGWQRKHKGWRIPLLGYSVQIANTTSLAQNNDNRLTNDCIGYDYWLECDIEN